MADQPYVDSYRLRVMLTRFRRAAGLTQKSAGKHFGWSEYKILRIEAGKSSVDLADLRGLLDLYGVTDTTTVDEMVAMAESARRRKVWWQDHIASIKDAGFAEYLDHETVATHVHNYQPLLIPGVLQTPEYTMGFLQSVVQPPPMEEILALRRKRQERLRNPTQGPQQTYVLDETALRRTVGDRQIMRGQLRLLLELGNTDHITIEVVPFECAEFRHLRVPHVLLEMPEGTSVAFRELPGADHLFHVDYEAREPSEELRVVTMYKEVFRALQELVSPNPRRVIERALEQY